MKRGLFAALLVCAALASITQATVAQTANAQTTMAQFTMAQTAAAQTGMAQSTMAQSATAQTAVPAPAPATSDAALNAHVNSIAKQLRCPVCQGLSLADSQSELSTQMRDVIRDQINLGKTDAQVIDYFVAKYGEWILLEPKATGFNLIAYLLPLLMLAAGVVVIYMSVKKWTRAETSVPAAAAN